MNYSDDEIKKAFDDFKNNLEVNKRIEERLIEMVKKRDVVEFRRKILLRLSCIAIAVFLVISSVTPVFGRNGTLPQVITGVNVQQAAKSFSGTLPTENKIIEELSDKNISPSDSIIIVALLKKTDVSLEKIIEMREKENMGWGKILTTLSVSLSDIKKEINSMAGKPDKNKPAETPTENSEANTKKEILSIKGTMESINGNTITVNDTKIELSENTSIKYHGKSISSDTISVGDELLVKAVKDNETLKAKDITMIKKANSNKEEQEREQKQEQEQEKEKEEFELRAKIVSFNDNILKITGFDYDIIVNENSHIEKEGTGRTDNTALEAGENIQIHIRKEGDKYYATSIVVFGTEKNDKENSQKAFIIKGTIESIDGNTITVNDTKIELSENTSIKYHGKSISSDTISVGDELLVKAVKDNETLKAKDITMIKKANSNKEEDNNENKKIKQEENPQNQSKKNTYRGVIASIDESNNYIFLSGYNLIFKISPLTAIVAQGKNKTLSTLSKGDTVEIIGTVQENNIILVEKIILLTQRSNKNSNSDNKGKGKP